MLSVLGGAAGTVLVVVDVPVTMQRRCCLANSRGASPESVDIPVVQQRRAQRSAMAVMAAMKGVGDFSHFSRSSGLSRS